MKTRSAASGIPILVYLLIFALAKPVNENQGTHEILETPRNGMKDESDFTWIKARD
jgi:hypothetical protein